MNRVPRILWTVATAKRRGRVAPGEVAVLPLRVLPNDIDFAWHMNNGVYFTMADLGGWARIEGDLYGPKGLWTAVAAEQAQARRN